MRSHRPSALPFAAALTAFGVIGLLRTVAGDGYPVEPWNAAFFIGCVTLGGLAGSLFGRLLGGGIRHLVLELFRSAESAGRRSETVVIAALRIYGVFLGLTLAGSPDHDSRHFFRGLAVVAVLAAVVCWWLAWRSPGADRRVGSSGHRRSDAL